MNHIRRKEYNANNTTVRSVRLKDGREGMVIEIFDDPELFLVNLDSSQEHGETITVYKEDIQIPN